MLDQGTRKILGIPVAVCDYESVLRKIAMHIKRKRGLLIFPLATHTLVESLFDTRLQSTLKKYDILTPDSWWLMQSLNWLYHLKIKKRVYGPELMERVLDFACEKKISIYLYGTDDFTLRALTVQIRKRFCDIPIVGYSAAPFRKITSNEKKQTVAAIIKSKAKIIFISLSSPKQVLLAKELYDMGGKKFICIPVGAGFDFIAHTKKQAPSWMQNNGFEWLFRLLQEPKRLFWRYLKSGTIFLILIIHQKIFSNTR